MAMRTSAELLIPLSTHHVAAVPFRSAGRDALDDRDATGGARIAREQLAEMRNVSRNVDAAALAKLAHADA